jgi:hypothetical protein
MGLRTVPWYHFLIPNHLAMTSAFFYGTLMHPKILKRVLHNDASHLKICPSILSDYTRHKVMVWLVHGAGLQSPRYHPVSQ